MTDLQRINAQEEVGCATVIVTCQSLPSISSWHHNSCTQISWASNTPIFRNKMKGHKRIMIPMPDLVNSSVLPWTLQLDLLFCSFFKIFLIYIRSNLSFFSFYIHLFLSYLCFLLSVWKQSDFASQDRFFAVLLWACDQKRSWKQCLTCYDIGTSLPDLGVADKTTSYACFFFFFF